MTRTGPSGRFSSFRWVFRQRDLSLVPQPFHMIEAERWNGRPRSRPCRSFANGVHEAVSEASRILHTMKCGKQLRLVRLGEVAELFDRDPVTIRRWIKKGEFLPPRLDGGECPYWLADELETYLRRSPVIESPGPLASVDQPITTSHRQVRR